MSGEQERRELMDVTPKRIISGWATNQELLHSLRQARFSVLIWRTSQKPTSGPGTTSCSSSFAIDSKIIERS